MRASLTAAIKVMTDIHSGVCSVGKHCKYYRDGSDEGCLAMTAVTAQFPRPLVMMESSGCVMDTVPAHCTTQYNLGIVSKANL